MAVFSSAGVEAVLDAGCGEVLRREEIEEVAEWSGETAFVEPYCVCDVWHRSSR